MEAPEGSSPGQAADSGEAGLVEVGPGEAGPEGVWVGGAGCLCLLKGGDLWVVVQDPLVPQLVLAPVLDHPVVFQMEALPGTVVTIRRKQSCWW